MLDYEGVFAGVCAERVFVGDEGRVLVGELGEVFGRAFGFEEF